MREFNDLHSKTVFMVFKELLSPAVENMAPGFKFENMVIHRHSGIEEDVVELRLFIKRKNHRGFDKISRNKG